NGTRHCEGNGLIRALERTGTRFGAHLNAHTRFDETVYKLQVPTADPETLDQTLLVLEDCAHRLAFDPDEPDREREVVLEERRRGPGAALRARDANWALTWAGSPHPERPPLGTGSSVESLTHEAVRRFYTD